MKALLIAALLILAGCSKPAPVIVYVTPPPKSAYELQLEQQAKADEEARTIGKAIFGAQQQGR